MLQCAYLHKTVNMVVFFVKSNENNYPNWRPIMHMYRVVPISKRGIVIENALANIHTCP